MAITLRIENEMIWDIFLFVSRTNFQDQLQVAQLGPQSIRLNILKGNRLDIRTESRQINCEIPHTRH